MYLDPYLSKKSKSIKLNHIIIDSETKVMDHQTNWIANQS